MTKKTLLFYNLDLFLPGLVTPIWIIQRIIFPNPASLMLIIQFLSALAQRINILIMQYY